MVTRLKWARIDFEKVTGKKNHFMDTDSDC